MPKLVAGSSLGFDDFTLIRVRVSLFVIYLLIDQAESFEKSLFFKYQVGFCFLKLLPFPKGSKVSFIKEKKTPKVLVLEDSPTKYAITTIKLKKT
jgi:hypothetical protein